MEPTEVAILVRRAAQGDVSAWEAIVETYSGLVVSIARRFRLGDAQAADAMQSTWLRLVENLDRIQDPERLAGWLRTTARRECIDAVRQGQRSSYGELREDCVPLWSNDAEGSVAAPEWSVLRSERERLVRQALAELTPRQRSLMLLLVARPRLSYQEIASRLGMPVGSVGPTRARVLARMRSTLETADFHDLAIG